MLIEQVKEVLIELREKPSFVWWGHQNLGAFPAAAKKPALHDKLSRAKSTLDQILVQGIVVSASCPVATLILESIRTGSRP
jgi:hypothetical protein